MNNQRKALFTAAALGVGGVLSLLAAEAVLRARGHLTWTTDPAAARQPTFVERDPELGWRNKPGEYVAPALDGSARTTRIHILPDSSRATSLEPPADGPLIALVGGSFTFGQGLSDHETLAWRLQDEFPGRRFRNLGTNAYGTLQSLIWMERLFASDDPPKLVLYGFLFHHDGRNVAPPEWIRSLIFSGRGYAYVPYATVDESGNLVRNPPLRFRPWALRRWSVAAGYIQDQLAPWRHNKRYAQRTAVTNKLIEAMNELSRRNGATFVVVVFDGMTDEQGYVRFMRENGIRYIDCDFPLWDSLKVPGDDHPNGEFNERWAGCIAEELGDEIDSVGQARGETESGAGHKSSLAATGRSPAV